MNGSFDDAGLDALRQHTDPLADAVVQQHFSTPGWSASQLFIALVKRSDGQPEAAADAVTAYLGDRPVWPDWADRDQVLSGQRVFEAWGPQILPSLMLSSLPQAYAAAKGVQVLHLTARLITDPRRRLIETLQMTIDAMAVGGMTVGAPGYRTARRVRLMHAAVRYLIDHDPLVHRGEDPTPIPVNSSSWQWMASWGRPINQEDLLGTLLTFTTVTLEALERLGVRLSRSDAEAYLHTWCLIGSYLGIRPDLLPLELDEAYALQATIRRRQFASSQAGHALVMALEELAASRMHPRWLSGLPRSTMWYLIGEDVADLLGVPAADWTRWIFAPLRRTMTAVSLQDQHDWLMRTVSRRVNELLITGFFDYERGGERPQFRLPTHLGDRWSIRPAT